MLKLVLASCNVELSGDSFIVTLLDLATEANAELSALERLAGGLREERDSNRSK